MTKKGKKSKKGGQMVRWEQLAPVPNAQQTSEIRRLTLAFTTMSSGGSLTGSATVLTSGVTSATEWANYSARWTQARVLSLRIRIVPVPLVGTVASGVPTTTQPSYIVIGTDRSGALSSGTIAATQALAAVKYAMFNIASPKLITYEAQASDFEDQNFDPVGSMVSRFGIQMSWIGPSASVAVGAYAVEYGVQFRGPR